MWILAKAPALGALLLLPAAASAQAPAESLTLEEAVERALHHHPNMIQAEAALDNAAWAYRSAWGDFLPDVSLSSSASDGSGRRFDNIRNEVISTPSQATRAGISAGIDLFTGGRRGADLARARAEGSEADAGLVEQRFAVALQVKRTFFDILRGEELTRVAEARLQRAQEGLDAAQRRLDVGSATRSDVLRAQLEISEARQDVLRAQNQQRSATYALGRLVGADGPVGARLTEPLEPSALQRDEAELLELALSASPAIRTAEATARTGRANVRSARSQYMPTLRLAGDYGWNNSDFSFDGGIANWTARLTLSYPLFNGFTREQNMARARTGVSVAEARLRDTRRLVQAELERVLGDLRLAEQQLKLTAEALEVAEEDLRVQQERYRLGVSTILDQITSQLNLVQAETNHVQARYDYQLARAELEALLGREL